MGMKKDYLWQELDPKVGHAVLKYLLEASHILAACMEEEGESLICEGNSFSH